jgi:hypothetical protein
MDVVNLVQRRYQDLKLTKMVILCNSTGYIL